MIWSAVAVVAAMLAGPPAASDWKTAGLLPPLGDVMYPDSYGGSASDTWSSIFARPGHELPTRWSATGLETGVRRWHQTDAAVLAAHIGFRAYTLCSLHL